MFNHFKGMAIGSGGTHVAGRAYHVDDCGVDFSFKTRSRQLPSVGENLHCG